MSIIIIDWGCVFHSVLVCGLFLFVCFFSFGVLLVCLISIHSAVTDTLQIPYYLFESPEDSIS